MESTDLGCETAIAARPTALGAAPADAPDGSGPPSADATAPPGDRAADCAMEPPSAASLAMTGARARPWRRGLLWTGAVAGLALGGYYLAPTLKTMRDT